MSATKNAVLQDGVSVLQDLDSWTPLNGCSGAQYASGTGEVCSNHFGQNEHLIVVKSTCKTNKLIGF